MGQAITALLRPLLAGEAQTSLLSDHNNDQKSFFDRCRRMAQAIIRILRRLLGGGGARNPPSDPPSDPFSSYLDHYYVDVHEAEGAGNDVVYEYSSPSPSPQSPLPPPSPTPQSPSPPPSPTPQSPSPPPSPTPQSPSPWSSLLRSDLLFSYPDHYCVDVHEAEGGGNDVVYEYSSPSPVEEQPRWGSLGSYSGWQRILLVGEGDFSFSASLGVAFGDASNMVATSLDSKKFLKKNYKKAMANISELTSRKCKVMHGVDATKMANHPQLHSHKFDCIIYNFPHAGFSKLDQPRDVQISHHQELVRGFMSNAKEMLEDDGEIHIAHKCIGFSKAWNLQMLGSSEGLRLIKAVPFNVEDYPGYSTKYGYGGDKDFDWKPSETYKFQLVSAPKKKKTRRKQKK